MQGKLLMNIAATSLFLFLASYPFFLPDVSFGQSVSFKVGTNVPVGINPTSVAVADFNGDGKSDLAVVNSGDNSVSPPIPGSLSILLGHGDGTFGAATNYTAGATPTSVAVGDFNGDGKMDLAVTNIDSNDVSVLLGNGKGSFGAATNFAAGSGPISVVVGDFNGDGKLDLAVGNAYSDNVSICLGHGDGTFGAATNFAAEGADSLAVGDFNGDGKLDLATTNVFLLGNGDGTFQAATSLGYVGWYPISVTIGDFNGDGKLDLAVANFASNNVSILLGNGDGTFQTATNFTVGSGPDSVAIGDFNGDGKPDLAVANNYLGTVSIALNTTHFSLAALLLPNGEAGVAYSAPLVTEGLGPYNFTLTKGTFPRGLTANTENGRLTGTPSLGKGGSFTVQVTDQFGSAVTGRYKIKIVAALSINTNYLKAGTSGKVYKGALTAKGGARPYAWSLISGNLPTGLTLEGLTGAITGKPTETGSFNPTFRVTDPLGGSAQKLLPFTIK